MKNRNRNRSRKSLLAIIFVVFALIVSSSIIVMDILYFARRAQGVALHNAVNKTKERESFLKAFLDDASSSILAIRESDFFVDYLEDGNEESVKTLFKTQMNTRSDLMQIRFIDNNGSELIKVYRQEIGDSPIIAKDIQLANKSDCYYFESSINKELEEVWFSSIDLNSEEDNIEIRNRATIRAILPIEVNGEFGGLIVINYFAQNMLDQLVYTPLYDMIICDNSGYVLYHYESKLGNEEKSWGNMSEDGYNISNEFLENYEEVLNKSALETSTLVSKHFDLPVDGGLIMILQLKESYIVEEQKRANTEYTTIICLVFVFSLILTFFIIRYFSNVLMNIDRIEKLNDTLDSASKISKIGFWEYEAKTRKMDWSNGVYDIFENISLNTHTTYDSFVQYIHVDDKEKTIKEFDKSIKEKVDFYITHRIVTENSNLKYVEERAKHYYDNNGNHIHSIGSIYDITEKYYTERRYEYLLDIASDGIHILDQKGNLIEFSQSFALNLGYDKDEMENMNICDWDTSIKKDEVEELIKSLMEKPRTYESKHRKKDGELIDVQINAKGITYNDKEHLYASQRDISEIKFVQKELEDNRKRWQFAVEGNNDGLWDYNINTNEVYYSKQCCALLGYEESEIEDSIEAWHNLVHKDDYNEMIKTLKEYLNKGEGTYIHEHRLLCKDGSYLWVRDRGIVIEHNSDGSPRRFIGSISDITEYRRTMRLLKEQTYIDELTGLYNRKAYNERLQELLEKHKCSQFMLSMIMLDIDDFKTINDKYGHAKGDIVLKEISKVLSNNIQNTDSCYRIGGDEFVILASCFKGMDIKEYADGIRMKIKNDVKALAEYNKKVTVSLGVVNALEDDTIDTIFKRADECMYKAKNNDKDSVVYQ